MIDTSNPNEEPKMTATSTTQNKVEKVTVTNTLTGAAVIFTMLRIGKTEVSNMKYADGESAWTMCNDFVQQGILRKTSTRIAGMGWHDTFYLNVKVA